MPDDTVEIWRLFALPDGTSSMECLHVNLPGGRSALLAGTGVQISRMKPDPVGSWHTGPRRQMLATIEGSGELETGDGQKLVVKPGVITLIEDLTGKGHVTRNGPEGRLALVFPIAEDTVIV